MADQAKPKRRISLKETFRNLVPELTEEEMAWVQVAVAVLVGLLTLGNTPLILCTSGLIQSIVAVWCRGKEQRAKFCV